MTIELKSPPAAAVYWICENRGTHSRCTVLAKLWSAARAEACRILGCSPGEVDCALAPEKPVENGSASGRRGGWMHRVDLTDRWPRRIEER